MNGVFLFYTAITFGIMLLITPLVRFFAQRFDIVDHPSSDRKVHKIPTPLLGGVAVFLAFVCGVLIAWPHLLGGFIQPQHLIGVLIAGGLIILGGVLDDKLNLSPKLQFIWPLAAVIVVMISGIGIHFVTNPFGGILPLDYLYVGYVITIFWLLGMMYTTKFLDGLDGLVSGVTVIGSVILFFVSLLPQLNQPQTALLALLVASAFAGFLVFNWHPAKIFLGEGGSLFAGFMLGVLSIIAGTKIATSLLILGIPILDVIWVIVRRLIIEGRSPFQADRKHLHLRLIDIGFSHRQAVLTLYFLTAGFGVTSLFLQTKQKFVALLIMLVVMLLLGYILVRRYRARST